MVSALLSRCLALVLGTLYPAYRSYKAIKNKDVREYVKWMMYWIVFALFTTLETFLDIFMSWFPFYYEIKILFILWVLSPATRGSSLLYKKVVHPLLNAREKEIDEFIEKTKKQGYSTFLQLFSSGFQYAQTIIIHSAFKSQSLIENQLRKSLSLNDVNNVDDNQNNNNSKNVVMKNVIIEEDMEFDEELENRILEDTQYLSNQNSATASKSKLPNNEETNDDQSDTIVKRQSKRNAAKQQASNYKTTDASHFGTVSRGKKLTKTKSKPQQSINTINDSDA